MIDAKDYSEVRQVALSAPASIADLAKAGWVLLGIERCRTQVTVQKAFAFMPSGGTYPQTYQYSDNDFEDILVAVAGLPAEVATRNWDLETSSLASAVTTTRGELAASKKSAEKLAAELTSAKLNVSQLEGKLTDAAMLFAKAATDNKNLREELEKLRIGMSQMVSKVGGATLAELQIQDQIEEEIKKAVEMPDAARPV